MQRTLVPPKAARTRSRSWPSTATTGLADEASTASATRRTIGLPSISMRSLLTSPMRRDWPAARMSAAMRGRRGAAGAAEPASARGRGRLGISARRPPAPIRMISSRVTAIPASRRCSTQSKPFSLGERAQPGRPSTGTPSSRPSRMRLPGSTGMPKCSIVPPHSLIAAGMTSRRSTIAEAPAIRIRPGFPAAASLIRAARLPTAWAQRSSPISRLPSEARRDFVTSTVLSRMLSLSPGSRVWISVASVGISGATRSSLPPSAAMAAQRSTSARLTPNGTILIVATICFGSTSAKGVNVARVTASSTRLKSSSRARSTTQRPRVSAKRLARPVKAVATLTLAPATASARRPAAASSPSSSAASRAATIVVSPASARAATSSALRTRPLRSARPGSLTLCARIAPTASATAISPNVMPMPSRRLAPLEAIDAQGGGDLREDRDGDLGRRQGADIEADRTVDAREVGRSEACLGQALAARGVGFARAQRADIEGLRAQGGGQRGIVELGIVRQSDDRGAAVGPQHRHGIVRPFGRESDAGKAQLAGEGAARIDDRDRVAGERRHLGQRRVENLDEDRAARRFDGRRAVVADGYLDGRDCSWIEGEIAFSFRALNEGLKTGFEVGRERGGAAGCGRRRRLLEEIELHSTGSTKTCTLPPQARPTSQACSLLTPKSSRRGLPSLIASSASWTTAPSMQPPETEPTKLPASSTASLEPTGRGEEPQVVTTVASATPLPAPRQSMACFRISSRSPKVFMASPLRSARLPPRRRRFEAPRRRAAEMGGEIVEAGEVVHGTELVDMRQDCP